MTKLKEWRRIKDQRYRVPLEGAQVFIRVWQQVNGWECKGGMRLFNALVPARGAGAEGRRGSRAGGKKG